MTKLVLIQDAVPSDLDRHGGQTLNQFVLLLTGASLDSEEDIRINTTFKFYSSKLAIFDDDQSHQLVLKVDPITTGGTRSVSFRNPTIINDWFVTEEQNQVLKNKTLSTNTQVTANLAFSNSAAITGAILSGASNTLSNIPNSALLQVTDKAKLNSNIVYNDQQNTYAASQHQNFRSGFLRLYNPAGTFLYTFVAGSLTGSNNLSIPTITAHDTFALKGIDNNFLEWQTIQKDSVYLLSLYRTSNTVGDDVGLSFDAWSSTGVKRTYASIFGTVVTPDNLAENGTLYFNVIASGTLGTKMAINHNGYLFIGSNLRLTLGESGLTAQRIFTFPDVAGRVVVESNANIFTNYNIFSYDSPVVAALRRPSNVIGNGA